MVLLLATSLQEDVRKNLQSAIHLLSIRQKEGKTLCDYVARINQEKLDLNDHEDKMVLTTIVANLTDGRFSFSLEKKPPKTLKRIFEVLQLRNKARM